MPRERQVGQPAVDQLIARVAAGQHGVVDLADLRACGLSKQAVSKRVAAGRLVPLYRGVFAIGHANVPFQGWCLAAVLACGAGAALSHFAAAVLWGLLDPTGRYPDVIAPTPRRHDGINTFQGTNYDVTVHKGIPVTTPAQTVIHLSSLAQFATLRRAVNQGLNLRLLTLRDLITHIHRGAKNLRAVLATAAPTRSENENAVLHLLDDAGIPKPLVNPQIAATNLIPDFLWRDKALILEADSEAYHDHLLARADDRTKQTILEALGYTVIRTSWAEITTRPDRMIARVSAGRAG
ncbi:type IV toxin-antitoxin system AbiEi family antitoxin domain-containing protein [Solirubrobacter taibaiensis]|nr:type IV toxin-antitoxin system AbiEi family antitoxin domain-containing protein [Solirubrobacter taibaiensis]